MRLVRGAELPYNVSIVTTRLGIRELRDNLPAMMRRVRNGETLEVTHHGVPVAMISPVDDDPVARMVARGEATLPTPLDRPIRRTPGSGSRTVSEWLEEDRGAR